MDISLYLVRKQRILGTRSKTSFFSFYMALCIPIHLRQRTSRVYQDHQPSGIYSCRLLAHSLYVLLLTFFLPATALSVDVFLLHSDFYTSSYRGWSQQSSILYSNAQTNHDILLPDIFMLPLQFPALRYHSASSDHHNLLLLSESCRRS